MNSTMESKGKNAEVNSYIIKTLLDSMKAMENDFKEFRREVREAMGKLGDAMKDGYATQEQHKTLKDDVEGMGGNVTKLQNWKIAVDNDGQFIGLVNRLRFITYASGILAFISTVVTLFQAFT